MDEQSRLRSVYARYRESDKKQQAWSLGNPGNARILDERSHTVEELLGSVLPLRADARVLEIGCGSGDVLSGCTRHGIPTNALVGVDLLHDRLIEGRRHHPILSLCCADARRMPFGDGTFSLLLVFTVFSSILDDAFAHVMACEIDRVLEPGGSVLWYDFRYRNPKNPDVRPMTAAGIDRLFPPYVKRQRTITLLPPLARRLGGMTPFLYPLLSTVPMLRTHICGLFTKPLEV